MIYGWGERPTCFSEEDGQYSGDMPAQDPGLDERYSGFPSGTYVQRQITKLCSKLFSYVP
jgi:hypothetical protein